MKAVAAVLEFVKILLELAPELAAVIKKALIAFGQQNDLDLSQISVDEHLDIDEEIDQLLNDYPPEVELAPAVGTADESMRDSPP
jgi:hypothetical protein